MELCTSNTFETVIALNAVDFLGDFDVTRFQPLSGFGTPEQLMAGVYLSTFWEWIAVEARQTYHPKGVGLLKDSSLDLAYYHRRLSLLSELAFELRATMDAYVTEKLRELGYRSPTILQIYFNTHNAFVRLG